MADKFQLKQLLKNLPQQGQVEWIGIRSEKRKALIVLDKVAVLKEGLEGDHFHAWKRPLVKVDIMPCAATAGLMPEWFYRVRLK